MYLDRVLQFVPFSLDISHAHYLSLSNVIQRLGLLGLRVQTVIVSLCVSHMLKISCLQLSGAKNSYSLGDLLSTKEMYAVTCLTKNKMPCIYPFTLTF